MLKNKTPLQKLSFLFGILFLLVFIVTNIPSFQDARGYNFGLFKIDPIDNVVHLMTAILGVWAAYVSIKASKLFFQVFGTLYMGDAFVGLVFSRGLLDTTIFTQGPGRSDFSLINWAVNAPHILIAGIMLVIGFSMHRMLSRA